MSDQCLACAAYGDVGITSQSLNELRSKIWGVSLSDHSPRTPNQHLVTKKKSVMLAEARAKTHIKTILRCISKLCQLRTASNEALSRQVSDVTDHNSHTLSIKY